jgi:hypothetical protein
LDDSIVSDDQWQQWADELEVLQKKNPKFMNIDFFDHEFKDWDGATGSHLPHRHPWVYAKSKYILDDIFKFITHYIIIYTAIVVAVHE